MFSIIIFEGKREEGKNDEEENKKREEISIIHVSFYPSPFFEIPASFSSWVSVKKGRMKKRKRKKRDVNYSLIFYLFPLFVNPSSLSFVRKCVEGKKGREEKRDIN